MKDIIPSNLWELGGELGAKVGTGTDGDTLLPETMNLPEQTPLRLQPCLIEYVWHGALKGEVYDKLVQRLFEFGQPLSALAT